MCEDVEQLSSRVRELYVRAYRAHREIRGISCDYGERRIPHWDGGVDSYGKNHKPIWPKIAHKLRQNNIDPSAAVRAAFADWKGGDPPRPTVLLSETVLQSALEAMEVRRQRLRADLPLMLQAFEQGRMSFDLLCGSKNELAIARAVLRDPAVPLSCVFRYCLAAALGFDDLASLFEAGAVSETAFLAEDYIAAWGDFIPANFAQKIRKADQ